MADKTIKFLLVGEDKSASKTLKGVGDEAKNTGGKLDGMKVAAGAALVGAGAAIVDFGAKSVSAFRMLSNLSANWRMPTSAFRLSPMSASRSSASSTLGSRRRPAPTPTT